MFGTKKRLNQQESQINVENRSQPINTTHSYKYLGVQLDPSLNMKAHFKGVCKKGLYPYTSTKKNKAFYQPLMGFHHSV